MKLTSLFGCLIIVTLLCGCHFHSLRPTLQGDGHTRAEQRKISDFTDLEINGAYTVRWTSGAPVLVITTDENLLSNIKSEVVGSTLKIRSESSFESRHGVQIFVNSSALARIRLNGAVNLTAQRITAGNFAIVSDGASTIQVDGNVTNLNAELNGASRLNAPALNAKAADVTLSGASNADIVVKDTLKATISGASTLTYSGQPANVEKQISGAGSIHPK